VNDFPYVAPAPDGLREAMAHARRRRFRTAGFSTSSVAAAMLVVAALAGGQATQSLIQEPAPQQPAVNQLVPVPVDGTTARNNTVGASTGRHSATTPQGTVARGAVDPAASSGSGSVSGTRSGASGRPGRPATTGPMQRAYGSPSIDECPLQKSTEQQAVLCPSGGYSNHWNDAGTAMVGEDLTGSVCSFDTRNLVLHFDTSLELDLTVLDEHGQALWRWSKENAAEPDQHTLALGTTECWQWTTLWRSVDQSGHRLAAGNYTLRVTSYAKELGKQNVYETGISVS